MARHDSDLIIIGAGPAGLALASAAADAGLSATLLEQQPRAAIEAPADDGREIAPLREARVLDGDAPAALQFAAGGDGSGALGWLVPNREIRRAALEAALARPAVQLHAQACVTALQRRADAAEVTLADGRRFSAPLVVAADSRHSQTRRLAGIGASLRDFGRSVVVGRVAHARPNEGIAWECFRYGNTLALLPMNDGQCSAVVTVASDQAEQWLALSDVEFAARIEQQCAGRLGAMRAVGARHHYALVSVYAHRFVAPRLALVGDASVGMHPVTAHGFNFGLYGIEVLARELQRARREGGDIGAPTTLEPYQSEHRRTTLPVYLGTNAIVSLFTDERRGAKIVRHAVLAAAQRAPLLGGLIRGGIVRQLTGRVGG